MHIHVKVHVDGTWTDAGYEGGHTCHTGQLFFDEKSVLATSVLEPYVSNTTTRTTLTEDGIYPQNGHEGGLLYLQYDRHRIGRGVRARLTLGVAPDETHDGSDGGGREAPAARAHPRRRHRHPRRPDGTKAPYAHPASPPPWKPRSGHTGIPMCLHRGRACHGRTGPEPPGPCHVKAWR